jgi:myo-inositol-1(or 4)-monophosphatase
MTDIPLIELEDFALELAHMAGGIAEASFRRAITVENKSASAFDPVTNADRAIERVLRTTILRRYPDHGIVAEEEGDQAGRGDYTWYIDPIDGTRAFMTGSPLWGTLIGLTQRNEPLFGVLVQPVLEEVFLGGPTGSWLIKPERRERLRRRDCTALASAVLACTHPDMFDGAEVAAFAALAKQCLLHRFGGDCYNYAMLAAGFIDLVVEAKLKPYDIVPLLPLLEGAGCVVTDWQGRRPMQGGRVVAAATPELHAAALAALR